MPVSQILLQGGTILYHERDDSITPLKDTDLLIENRIIKEIGKGLAASSTARVIDCRGRIVCPGLIDTHHHLWQTQLKGRFNDDTLFDYMPKGNMASYAFTNEDLYLGQLAGCLEAIDAGTTMVVDHAHGAYSAEHGLFEL